VSIPREAVVPAGLAATALPSPERAPAAARAAVTDTSARRATVPRAAPSAAFGAIALSTPAFGWREQLALWRGTAGAMRRDDDYALRRFETRVAARGGAGAAMATTSGSTALHLALRALGVGAGDTVLVPMLAPFAVVAPILSLGAVPILVDVDATSWTLSPGLLEQYLRGHTDRMPRALIAVDLYGQTCNFTDLLPICAQYNIPVIEDASEALGATWRDRPAGGVGTLGVVSFGANKIASTGAGGAVLCRDVTLLARIRQLAGLAAEPGGTADAAQFGSRMSPVLAALGSAQLDRLEQSVIARRRVAQRYARKLADVPGVAIVPEVPWGRSSRWLSVLTVDVTTFGARASTMCELLRRQGIACRPVWQALHHTPGLDAAARVGGAVAERLASRGLCLPSGAVLTREAQNRVIHAIRGCQR